MFMVDGMVCPVCGEGIMKKILRDADFEYKGRIITFKDCEMYVCSNCIVGCEGEFFENPIENVIDDTLRAMRISIDANIS